MAVSARRLPKLEPSREPTSGPARELKELLAQSRARRFVVQLSENSAAPRTSVRAADFLQAAISSVETFAIDVRAKEVNVAVTDCETGEQRCFTLSV